MITSALTVAEDAFAVLIARPSPLSFDARGIPGLPDRHLGLDQLRDHLVGRVVSAQTSDEVWRRLAFSARQWGPAWVVAAVGVALPGLTRIASRLSTGRAAQAEDIDSEVMVGFLQALRTDDLNAPRVWLRLMWAAWRAGNRARHVDETVELPIDLAVGSSTPRAPYGHPDLILGRAVAVGVLSEYDAALIGDTRIGGALIEQLAHAQGTTAQILRMRRQRAERILVAALRQGDLSGTARRPRTLRGGTTHARRNGLIRPSSTKLRRPGDSSAA